MLWKRLTFQGVHAEAFAITISTVRLIRQTLFLVLVGGFIGLGVNWASPRSVALWRPVYPTSSSGTASCSEPNLPTIMSQAEAIAACGSCQVGFVDARGGSAYAAGHIPGAVHLPPQGHPEEAAALEALRRFPTVVVYDTGSGCQLARAVAERLRQAGFADVRILDGSWPTWQETGGPAQSGACQACAGDEHEGKHP